MAIVQVIQQNFNRRFSYGKTLQKVDLSEIKFFLEESENQLKEIYKAKEIFDENEKEINKLFEELKKKNLELTNYFNKNILFKLDIKKKIFSKEGSLEINEIVKNDKYFFIYNEFLQIANKLVTGKFKYCDTYIAHNLIEGINYPNDLNEQIKQLKKISIGDNLKEFLKENYNLKTKYKNFPHWSLKLKFQEGAYTSPSLSDFLDITNIDIPKKVSTDEIKKFDETQKKYMERAERELRRRLRSQHLQSVDAYVYVLSNKAYPDTYKIGSTTGTPEDRAKELSTTGVLYPFRVEFKEKFKNAEYVEKKIVHKILNKNRLKSNREFFGLELKNLKEIIKRIKKNEDEIKKRNFVQDFIKNNRDLIN